MSDSHDSPASIPCRFGDGPAVAEFELDRGCLVYPADRRQFLCEHHARRATPLGSMRLLRVLPQARVTDGAEIPWRDE